MRTRREIKMLKFLNEKDLNGQHVMRIHDVYRTKSFGGPCLVMDLFRGNTLKEEVSLSKKGLPIPMIR